MGQKAHKQLELARNLTNQGNYEGALKAYGDVVSLFPGDPPGDRAMFHMGLIWSRPDNPQKNYEKALACYERLPVEFPGSTYKDKAVVWTNVINELLRFEAKAEGLEAEVRTLKKRLGGSRKKINALRTELDGSKKKINVLKTRLNALKEIDIGIEEKKMKNRTPK